MSFKRGTILLSIAWGFWVIVAYLINAWLTRRFTPEVIGAYGLVVSVVWWIQIMVINGMLLTYSGWMFVVKRGRIEASGLINLAKSLRDLTGVEQMIWFGQHYPYQAAMVVGGVLLTIAAVLKLAQRLSEQPALESAGG